MKKQPDDERRARVVSEALREQALRGQGYREQALAIYPHVCARCGREFSGRTLRELTVHHKDHDHLNNPSDGSNWELLCLYCHDDEHQRYSDDDYQSGSVSDRDKEPPLDFRPFEGLDKGLASEGEDSDSPQE